MPDDMRIMEIQYNTLWFGGILATEVIKASISVLKSAARAIFRHRLGSRNKDKSHQDVSRRHKLKKHKVKRDPDVLLGWR